MFPKDILISISPSGPESSTRPGSSYQTKNLLSLSSGRDIRLSQWRQSLPCGNAAPFRGRGLSEVLAQQAETFAHEAGVAETVFWTKAPAFHSRVDRMDRYSICERPKGLFR